MDVSLGDIVAVLTLLGGALVWVIHVIISPLKVLLDRVKAWTSWTKHSARSVPGGNRLKSGWKQLKPGGKATPTGLMDWRRPRKNA